jgi:plastocyanin
MRPQWGQRSGGISMEASTRPARSPGVLLVALVAAIAGCVSERPEPAGPDAGGGEEVRIRDFAFVPPDLTVRIGTPVVWTNEDAVLHTVTAEDGRFDSSTFGQGRTFRLTPERVGTFPYICTVHPFMRATIRVTQ